MTTLYRPVEITSIEQVEDLPIGTLFVQQLNVDDLLPMPYVKASKSYWYGPEAWPPPCSRPTPAAPALAGSCSTRGGRRGGRYLGGGGERWLFVSPVIG